MANEQMQSGPKGEDANTPPLPAATLTLNSPATDPPTLNAFTLPPSDSPAPALPPAPPVSPPPRRPVGKVARLPVEIRNLVCRALRQGRRYRDIVALLEAQGFPGISEHNISNWARGSGYRQWLEFQQRFESQHNLSDRLQALLGQLEPDGHSTLADFNESMLLGYFHEILAAFDVPDLPEKSDDFLRVAKTFSTYLSARSHRQRADLERLSYQLELRKLEHQKKTRKPGGLTPETIRLLEEKGKML